jgi:hypothetical protein
LNAGVEFAERFRDRKEPVALHPPLPRGHDGAVVRVDPHQRRRRLDMLEIDADRQDVGDARPVIQLQHRHGAVRVDRAESVAELLALAQIHLDRRQHDPLLGQEDAHPTRARRNGAVVEFHGEALQIKSINTTKVGSWHPHQLGDINI